MKQVEETPKAEVDLFQFFNIPLPKWQGEQFVTSRQFLKAHKKFQCSDKGYICIDDVDAFLNVLFIDAEEKGIGFHPIKTFQRDFSFYMEHRREYWIPMKLLFTSLPMMEISFLKVFRGRISYTASDYMKMWQYYDHELKGYLDKDDLTSLVFDLLLDLEQKCNPKILAVVMEKMIKQSKCEDGNITFIGLKKIMKVDKNFMVQFNDLSNLTPADVDRIFAYYDPDDNGTLGVLELDALVGDLADKEGKGGDVPYIIEKRNEYLKKINVNEIDGQVAKDQLALLVL